jgi:hypothetical protein
MTPKIYKRLKNYIGAQLWIRKKHKEINEEITYILMNEAIFSTNINRNGTHDFSIQLTYKLRGTSDGGPKMVSGTSVDNFRKMTKSLMKASYILNKFEKKIKNRGWFYDKMAINEKASRLRREKWEAIAAEHSGVSTFNSNVSIPN